MHIFVKSRVAYYCAFQSSRQREESWVGWGRAGSECQVR